MTGRSQQYPRELRERTVRMVAEVTPNYESRWAAMGAVAQKLGVGTAETMRKSTRLRSTLGRCRGCPQRSRLSDLPPAELEQAHYRQHAALAEAGQPTP